MRLKITYKGRESFLSFDKNQISIGRSKDCDLQLKGWFIADTHAYLKKLSGGYIIQDANRGANGTIVNSAKVDHYGPIDLEKDHIFIGSYNINIVHEEDIEKEEEILTINPEEIGNEKKEDSRKDIIIDEYAISVLPKDKKYKEIEYHWLKIFRDELIKKMDIRRRNINEMEYEELKKETILCLQQVMLEQEERIPSLLDVDEIKKKIINETIGLGPLEELLKDNSISEIMVNAKDEIYIEQYGRLLKSDLEFSSNRAVLDIIERIVTPIGRRIDESSPMVDARLPDGSRVNAIIPPLALKGPTITIRKFPDKRLNIKDLIDYNSISEGMAEFLDNCVKYKKNIIISGGTGSGKTTLLNVIANFIPKGERVITIEDAAELKLSHDHLISLEARPGNAEGKGLIAIRDLVKNSLRMRPDRIVIGECRGAEALDMLQAMNTGHEGSLTTLHANTPRDAISRLETMILMAGMDLPLNAIREQVVAAVDIIIQQTRFSCGSRKVTYITEVTGMESGRIQLQDIFVFEKKGMDPKSSKILGVFKATGFIPTFYQDLKDSGVNLNIDSFSM